MRFALAAPGLHRRACPLRRRSFFLEGARSKMRTQARLYLSALLAAGCNAAARPQKGTLSLHGLGFDPH